MKHVSSIFALMMVFGLSLGGCLDPSSTNSESGDEPPSRDARVEGAGGADDDAGDPGAVDMEVVDPADMMVQPAADADPTPVSDASPPPAQDASPAPDPDAAPEPNPDAAPGPEPDAAPEPEPDAAPEPVECPAADIPVPEEWPPPTPDEPYLLFGTVNAAAGDAVTVPVYLVGQVDAIAFQFDAHFDDGVVTPTGENDEPPRVFAGPDAAASGHSVSGNANPCRVRVVSFSFANAVYADVDDDHHRHVANVSFRVHDDAEAGRTVIWGFDSVVSGAAANAIPHGVIPGSIIVQ